MRRFLYLGLGLTGFLALAVFSVSLYRSLRLYTLTPEPAIVLVYHFSLYIPDNRNSFFEGIIRGAEQAAAELNSAISVHSVDPAKNELEFAAFTGADGVIICPYLDDALAQRQLEKFRESQLPVVLINNNLPSDQPWPFVGVNNFDLGRRIGLMLPDFPGKIQVIVVYSSKAPGIYRERELVEMGIAASLENRLSGPVIRHRTNLNPLDAEALMLRIFRSPDIRSQDPLAINSQDSTAIVFTDPEDTIAAAQALVDMNLVGKVHVIGFGGEPEIMESLQKEIIGASVIINSERIGYEAVHSLAALCNAGFTSASIDTEIKIITGSGQ